jgi:hypothetical protein
MDVIRLIEHLQDLAQPLGLAYVVSVDRDDVANLCAERLSCLVHVGTSFRGVTNRRKGARPVHQRSH